MLLHHIKGAIEDLKDLISMTKLDIGDIQEAKQDSQFARIMLKDEKIKTFESKKSMIDHEIQTLIKLSPYVELKESLSEPQREALNLLKENLTTLREVNQQYAKLILAVSSFYNSLLEQLVPTEMDGYNKITSRKSTFLEARV